MDIFAQSGHQLIALQLIDWYIHRRDAEVIQQEYTEHTEQNPDYDPEDETSQETITTKEPVPFSMENVTLKLYAI